MNFQPVLGDGDKVAVFAAVFPWDLVGARPVPALGRGVHPPTLVDEELAVVTRVVLQWPGLTPCTTLLQSCRPVRLFQTTKEFDKT